MSDVLSIKMQSLVCGALGFYKVENVRELQVGGVGGLTVGVLWGQPGLSPIMTDPSSLSQHPRFESKPERRSLVPFPNQRAPLWSGIFSFLLKGFTINSPPNNRNGGIKAEIRRALSDTI